MRIWLAVNLNAALLLLLCTDQEDDGALLLGMITWLLSTGSYGLIIFTPVKKTVPQAIQTKSDLVSNAN